MNLFGDVPLITSTDPLKNAVLGQSPAKTVYTQIIKDLNEAKVVLSEKVLK